MNDIASWAQWGQEIAVTYGLKILAALAIFIVGRWVAKWIRTLLDKALVKSRVEETLRTFALHSAYALMMVFIILAALHQLGVQTTSFIAVLGAAGLAVGLALQGSLSNFASGVLLLIFRPFKAGDFIDAGGTMGIVESLQIFTTTLRTPDNKTVIVPNAQITAATITNFSARDTRRMDLVVGVSYGDNLAHVKQVLQSIVNADKRILEDPAPTIGVLELADSSVNFAIRPWVRTAEYWDVYFDLLQAIKEGLDQEGITIPFPQRDVHLAQPSPPPPTRPETHSEEGPSS